MERDRRLEKQFKKLESKKLALIKWLDAFEDGIVPTTPHIEVLKAAYEKLGKTWKNKKTKIGPSSIASHYGNVFQWIGGVGTEDAVETRRKPARREAVTSISEFYKSYEWRKFRYEILKRDGAKCVVCGASPESGSIMHVDHIKPLRKYWELRLEPSNMQVLCAICNHGKGSWDDTDWRPTAQHERTGE